MTEKIRTIADSEHHGGIIKHSLWLLNRNNKETATDYLKSSHPAEKIIKLWLLPTEKNT